MEVNLRRCSAAVVVDFIVRVVGYCMPRLWTLYDSGHCMMASDDAKIGVADGCSTASVGFWWAGKLAMSSESVSVSR